MKKFPYGIERKMNTFQFPSDSVPFRGTKAIRKGLGDYNALTFLLVGTTLRPHLMKLIHPVRQHLQNHP